MQAQQAGRTVDGQREGRCGSVQPGSGVWRPQRLLRPRPATSRATQAAAVSLSSMTARSVRLASTARRSVVGQRAATSAGMSSRVGQPPRLSGAAMPTPCSRSCCAGANNWRMPDSRAPISASSWAGPGRGRGSPAASVGAPCRRNPPAARPRCAGPPGCRWRVRRRGSATTAPTAGPPGRAAAHRATAAHQPPAAWRSWTRSGQCAASGAQSRRRAARRAAGGPAAPAARCPGASRPGWSRAVSGRRRRPHLRPDWWPDWRAEWWAKWRSLRPSHQARSSSAIPPCLRMKLAQGCNPPVWTVANACFSRS